MIHVEPVQKPAPPAAAEPLTPYIPFDKTSDLLSAIRKPPLPYAPSMAPQATLPQFLPQQPSQIIVPQPTYLNISYSPGPPFRPNMKHAVIAYHIYFEHEYEMDAKRATEEKIDRDPRKIDPLFAGGIK